MLGAALTIVVIVGALKVLILRRLLLLGLGSVFALAIGLRFLLVGLVALRITARPPPPRTAEDDLPSYSVIVPLFREAEMVAGLLAAIERVDYPRDRLQLLFALEPDDPATLGAVMRAAAGSPLDVQIVVAQPDGPKTKPKACNTALTIARGRLIVVYDAEDRPHPQQLREAAARFAVGDPKIGCLQAPLRVYLDDEARRSWMKRQFAMEYGALFGVVLPAFAHLGLPFPLGGTSNHFKREALDDALGWDAWNVTEDADMGLRLAALGWRLGVLDLPTEESAPRDLKIWLRQRTRWIKGHMQTWGVHAQRPLTGGWRRTFALPATIGLSVMSAVLHGWIEFLVVWSAGDSILRRRLPDGVWLDGGLLMGGLLAAWACIFVGARIARFRLRFSDLLTAPLYWSLQSAAAVISVLELFTRPFHWSKTPHEPYAGDAVFGSADGAQGLEVASALPQALSH